MRHECFRIILVVLTLAFAPMISLAQAVDVTDQTAVEDGTEAATPPATARPETGTRAAQKYFRARTAQNKDTAPAAARPSRGPTEGASAPHYLALNFGSFFSEDTYKWGKGRRDDPGQLTMGVTYKLGEWANSADFVFKSDITTYGLTEGRAVKFSLIPAIIFPEAGSQFPLYFGIGAGLGVFFKQIEDESSLSFDYTLIAGARFFDIWEGGGLLVETGMKNHILLLSDGQFNGVYFAVGAVFQF
jgi:hypothetical protein